MIITQRQILCRLSKYNQPEVVGCDLKVVIEIPDSVSGVYVLDFRNLYANDVTLTFDASGNVAASSSVFKLAFYKQQSVKHILDNLVASNKIFWCSFPVSRDYTAVVSECTCKHYIEVKSEGVYLAFFKGTFHFQLSM